MIIQIQLPALLLLLLDLAWLEFLNPIKALLTPINLYKTCNRYLPMLCMSSLQYPQRDCLALLVIITPICVMFAVSLEFGQA